MKDEALKLALEVMHNQGDVGVDEWIAAEAAINQALAAPVQPEQEPVGFAGIEMWIGNARIKKLMTQAELHYAIDPWAIVKFNSDHCIDALKEKNNG
jgi:hypothetical protein